MHQNFCTIATDKCLEVEPLAASNANMLYESAFLLAAEGKFGPAVSPLILGAEEKLKAVFLLLEGHGFGLRSKKGFNKLFYNHSSRHSIFKTFFSVWLAVEPFYHARINPIKKRLPVKNLLANVIANLPVSLSRSFLNYSWWDEADRLKQQGLYVDNQDKISTPASISEGQYGVALRHIRELDATANKLTTFITTLDTKGLVELKSTLAEASIFEIMEESL